MRLPSFSKLESKPMRSPDRGRFSASPLIAALAFSLLVLVAVGLAGAGPATAASPTMSPFTPGRHVYDYGKVLSATSATAAEALAAHIESEGGGRVAIYTADQNSTLPDQAKLASAWFVNGLLITAQTDEGQLLLGASLKGKLTTVQSKIVTNNSSPGQATTESWIMTTLARVDAFVSGTHVFDGAGALNASGMQQAETAAKNLGSQLGDTVYIDIAIGGDDPSSTAFFNGADLSDAYDAKTLIIALAVSDGEIGGYIDSTSDVCDTYNTNSPWKSDTLSNQKATNGDVQATLLALIGDVQKPPLISSDAIPVMVFVVVVLIFSLTAPFLWGPWLIRKLSGTTAPIKGGMPGDAIIESIADTGVTVSMPGVGPEAPDYKFVLQVTPRFGGGAPYQVTTKALVPRIFIPMVVPGAHVGVLIDPTDPQKVSIDFSQMGGSAPAAGTAYGATGAAAGGGMDFNFDASGQPAAGDLSAMLGAVRSGTMPTIKGSAAQLLATGTHGTAVITTCQPMGKKVRDIDPSADPSHLDDPVWLFTLEVTLAGEAPFPAVFGHRVPVAKVGLIGPGVKLAVAVDQSNKNQDVAIDWDKSPLAG